MYLSRLILNGRHRVVWHDLGDCQAMHRTVMSAFPGALPEPGGRVGLGVLYRIDSRPRTGGVALLVQSAVKPDWSRLPGDYLAPAEFGEENPTTKEVGAAYSRIAAGAVLRFRLRANPTRRVSASQDRLSGKRVALLKEEEQLVWLRRKGEEGGFALVRVRANPDVANVRANPEGTLTGMRRVVEPAGGAAQTQRLTFGAVLFEGELRVTDLAAFRRTLAQGIGAGKAYGFGLLSVAPAGGGR